MSLPSIACLLACLFAAPPQDALEELFETLGKRLVAAAESAAPEPIVEQASWSGEQRLMARLERVHHAYDLGLTEIWVPWLALDSQGAIGEPKPPKAWPMLAKASVELQTVWYARLAPADDGRRGREALEALARWTKRLQPGAEPTRDEDLRAAALALRALWIDESQRMRVVVAPTRAQFLGLFGATGLFDAGLRGALWTPLTARSANSYFVPSSLGFALVGGPLTESDPPLRERELEAEAVRTYATHALCHQIASQLVPTAPLWFGEGLALFDTVALVGVDETLCAGYSGRKVTSLDDVQSAMSNALVYTRIERSPYRTGGCKDLFVDELRVARSSEGFLVLDLDDPAGGGVVLPGPFLLERPVQPQLVATGAKGLKEGYAEFFRAYCGGFVAFLADQRAGKLSLLDAALRRLHERRFDGSAEQRTLGSVLGELTGKTLGHSRDPATDLEGLYAEWLGERR